MAKAVIDKEARKTKKTLQWYEGTGRRKTSVARVRLILEKGPISVNDKPIEEYFSGVASQKEYEKPFTIVSRLGTFRATIKVVGGGPSSQLGSVVHGIANALVNYDNSLRSQLSVAGLLTRDPRMKERRKFGLAGKARKQKQSPKR